MKSYLAAIAAVFMLAGSAFAANVDEQFLSQAYGDSMHEVAMGKMASQKATSPDVKQFGQQMADDHTKMATEMKDLAQKLNFDLSKAPNAEEMHKQHADQFNKLSGAQWDRAFMDWAVTDHNKGVAAFENQIKNGKNADIVAFAGKFLPDLRKHQQMATDLNARISKGAEAEFAPAEQPVLVERSRQTISESTAQNVEPLNYRQVETNTAMRTTNATNVSYEPRYVESGTYVNYSGDCHSCEKKCNSCGTDDWPDFVYDNDYRALITELKDDYYEDCH